MLRDLSQQAIKSAKKIPIGAMLDYLNRFDEEAQHLYEKLNELRAVNTSRMNKKLKREHESKIKEVWALFRECTLDAHRFAVDAAPYIHQRLSSTSISVTTDRIVAKPEGEMNPDELAEYYNKLRMRPTSVTPLVIDNDTGDVVVVHEDAE